MNISALTTPDILKRNANRLFYGWWIVAAAIVIQGLQGGLLLQSFGAYFLELQDEFGWSSAALAWSFSILQLQNGLLGPVQGLLVDRFGPRFVLTAGIIVLALGFLLLSQIQSLLTFYLAFLVLSVGFGLSGYLTLIVAVANWFQRRRSLALALSTTGLGLGGMLVPLVAISLSSFGWRHTAIASAIIILAVGLPLMPIIRGRPERYGMRPDGGPDPRAATNTSRAMQTARDFTVGEAIRTRAFWLISFGHGSALLVVGAIMVHLIPHLVHRLEVSLASAALVVTVMTMTSMVGQIGGGLLGDRLDKRLICAVGMVAHCVALLGITFATSLAVVYFFAILHGLAWGGRGPLMGAIRADYFRAAVAGDHHGAVFRHSHIGNHVRPGVCGVDGGPEGRLSAGIRGAGQHDGAGVSVLSCCEATATAHEKAGGDAETSPCEAGAAVRTKGNAPDPGARLASKADPPPAPLLPT